MDLSDQSFNDFMHSTFQLGSLRELVLQRKRLDPDQINNIIDNI